MKSNNNLRQATAIESIRMSLLLLLIVFIISFFHLFTFRFFLRKCSAVNTEKKKEIFHCGCNNVVETSGNVDLLVGKCKSKCHLKNEVQHCQKLFRFSTLPKIIQIFTFKNELLFQKKKWKRKAKKLNKHNPRQTKKKKVLFFFLFLFLFLRI